MAPSQSVEWLWTPGSRSGGAQIDKGVPGTTELRGSALAIGLHLIRVPFNPSERAPDEKNHDTGIPLSLANRAVDLEMGFTCHGAEGSQSVPLPGCLRGPRSTCTARPFHRGCRRTLPRRRGR